MRPTAYLTSMIGQLVISRQENELNSRLTKRPKTEFFEHVQSMNNFCHVAHARARASAKSLLAYDSNENYLTLFFIVLMFFLFDRSFLDFPLFAFVVDHNRSLQSVTSRISMWFKAINGAMSLFKTILECKTQHLYAVFVCSFKTYP